MFWNIIAWVVLTLVSAALAPKPKPENAQPGTIGDKDVPTASESTPIPVVFGTVLLQQPNVVWWGDVKTTAIKSGGGGKK